MSTSHFRPWPYALVLALAALVVAVVWIFFLIGLSDGSVSSYNMALWLGLLAFVSAVLAIGLNLRTRDRVKAAVGVLSLLAIPGALYALFVILLLVLQPNWH